MRASLNRGALTSIRIKVQKKALKYVKKALKTLTCAEINDKINQHLGFRGVIFSCSEGALWLRKAQETRLLYRARNVSREITILLKIKRTMRKDWR